MRYYILLFCFRKILDFQVVCVCVAFFFFFLGGDQSHFDLNKKDGGLL